VENSVIYLILTCKLANKYYWKVEFS